jgi:hypothetical protein
MCTIVFRQPHATEDAVVNVFFSGTGFPIKKKPTSSGVVQLGWNAIENLEFYANFTIKETSATEG